MSGQKVRQTDGRTNRRMDRQTDRLIILTVLWEVENSAAEYCYLVAEELSNREVAVSFGPMVRQTNRQTDGQKD